MTDVTTTIGGGSGLPSGGSAQSGPSGLEAVPGLVSLVASGAAPVCEGDSCFVPGAEGAWTEVPD